ncbi:MAG: ABC transporter ATP-binding protein [Candidatus Kapabacteria bacterium]|nr:ABC transporter ATP-binding protein [Candidatus Kapabacteria bacterium]
MKEAIKVENVSMKYEKSKVIALDNISFKINENDIFGLIGPDGAGKTTLFRILTTLILPTQGSVEIYGFKTTKDYKQIRQFIGYVPERFSLYQDLTVYENLNFFASVYKTTIKENYAVIKDIFIHLEPFKNRKAGKLSGGMKQKLALCCALINKPKILFLDEPTTGVDPVSRIEFWETIKKLKENGITIIVSTPYMDEAKLCDRIALMFNSKILNISTPDDIISNFESNIFKIKSDNNSYLKKILNDFDKLFTAYYFGDSVHLAISKELAINEEQIISMINEKNIKIFEFSLIAPTIEDCFIKYLTNG